MASLVQWLKFTGARKSDGTAVSSGSAWFYQPGTTATQITVFADGDGLSALTQPVALDASGRAEVYTDVPARIEIEDSAGVPVAQSSRANTVTAEQVEIQNAGATGIDLETGAQVAGGRTDVDAFISALNTSFGAPDGKVLVGGSAVYLKNAIVGGIATVTQYGAVGNDIADDTAAIQAAVTAVAAAGGSILIFPPGTYRISSVISVTGNGLTIMGAHPGVCTIKQYTDSAEVFSSSTGINVTGITFTANTSTKATFLQVATALGVESAISNCIFTGATSVKFGTINISGVATFTGCKFTDTQIVGGTSGGQADSISVIGGMFTLNGQTMKTLKALLSSSFTVAGALFYSPGSDGLTIQVCDTASDGSFHLIGCRFSAPGTNPLGVAPLGAGGFSGSGQLYEVGCSLDTASRMTGTNSTGETPYLSSWREASYFRNSTTAGSYTPDANTKYHHHTDNQAAFAFQTPVNVPSNSASAVELVLIYKNTSGGAVTPTFSAAYKVASASVANNQACAWTFVYDATLTCWVQMSTSGPYNS